MRPALAVLTVAVLAGLAVAWRLAAAQPGTAARSPLAAAVARGQHTRIASPRGPVHVWAPAGYHADGAALVVYVHGYYTDVDRAWQEHRLAEQFALSALNAVFVAPKAPGGARPPVAFPSLTELVQLATGETGLARPTGPIIVIGHSGGYRTLLQWIDEPMLDTVILLDALYGELEPFAAWLDGGPGRQLINVGDDTVRWTEEMARQRPTLELDFFPPEALPRDVATAPSTYIRSQYGHMPLVEDGIAIPMILRALPVEQLADAPWRMPVGLPTAAAK